MTAANEKPNCPCCKTSETVYPLSSVSHPRYRCGNCKCEWYEDERRAQPAEAVDDAEYTQGFAYDGVVILKDGQPITIDEVLAMLNARSGTVDEDKEWEAFTEWLFKQPATRIDPFVAWLARARGGN